MVGFLAFFVTNFKLLLGTAGVITIAVLGFNVYNGILEAGRNQVLIEELRQDIVTLEQELAAKDITIEIQQENAKIVSDILSERDAEITNLQRQLRSVLANLGEDQNDEAAESLRETLRRLQEIRNNS